MASFGVQIFWMISLGLVIGYIGHFLYLKYSVPTWLSLLLSTLGAVLMGIIAHFMAFDLPLMYAFLGAIIFLFIGNAFLSLED